MGGTGRRGAVEIRIRHGRKCAVNLPSRRSGLRCLGRLVLAAGGSPGTLGNTPPGATEGAAGAWLERPGDLVQPALWDGPPRVLSCSSLRDEIPHSLPVFLGCEGQTPSLVVRSDDVGRSFVYSRPRLSPVPPSQRGRVYRTDRLSSKGARAVQGAALKAVQTGRPFRAMWSATVRDEFLGDFLPADGFDGVQRPVRVLSDEFRRFWHWVTDYCARNGHPRPVYCYVCESKSDGARDYHPHLHLLTSLVLTRSEWLEFRGAAESAWGLGSVHMETIKRPRNAAVYLLKAAEYSVKGATSEQGRVWGRRWSCSRDVRPVEERSPLEFSGSDALSLEEVASLLRDLGRESVRTDFGSVTVRGFYPADGFAASDVWLAIAAARSTLEGVSADASLDSSGVPPEAQASSEPF